MLFEGSKNKQGVGVVRQFQATGIRRNYIYVVNACSLMCSGRNSPDTMRSSKKNELEVQTHTHTEGDKFPKLQADDAR